MTKISEETITRLEEKCTSLENTVELLKTSLDELEFHLTKQAKVTIKVRDKFKEKWLLSARFKRTLEEIAAFANANPGCGYSCGKMAENALNKYRQEKKNG